MTAHRRLTVVSGRPSAEIAHDWTPSRAHMSRVVGRGLPVARSLADEAREKNSLFARCLTHSWSFVRGNFAGRVGVAVA